MKKCEVVKKIGVLEEYEDGGTVQANIISWYGRAPVLDIRNWSQDGKPKKGVCLRAKALEELKKQISDITLG